MSEVLVPRDVEVGPARLRRASCEGDGDDRCDEDDGDRGARALAPEDRLVAADDGEGSRDRRSARRSADEGGAADARRNCVRVVAVPPEPDERRGRHGDERRDQHEAPRARSERSARGQADAECEPRGLAAAEDERKRERRHRRRAEGANGRRVGLGEDAEPEQHPHPREDPDGVGVAERLRDQIALEAVIDASLEQVAQQRVDEQPGDGDVRRSDERPRRALPREHDERERERRVDEHAPRLEHRLLRLRRPDRGAERPDEQRHRDRRPAPGRAERAGPRRDEAERGRPGRERAGPDPRVGLEAALHGAEGRDEEERCPGDCGAGHRDILAARSERYVRLAPERGRRPRRPCPERMPRACSPRS